MNDRLQRSMALMDAKADVKMIKERTNECWYDTKILANAVYLILEELTATDIADTPQTESTGSPIGDYRDGVGAWQTERMTEEEIDTMLAKALMGQTDCDDIYPLVIIEDRYTGVYSNGEYTAWNMYFDEIPQDIDGDDVSCYDFWHSYNGIVGLGRTPNEAIEDLRKKLNAERNEDEK